jgi:hypothetical protein
LLDLASTYEALGLLDKEIATLEEAIGIMRVTPDSLNPRSYEDKLQHLKHIAEQRGKRTNLSGEN